MKFYLASGLDNRVAARSLMEHLRGLGHTLTHDWTLAEGAAHEHGEQRMHDVAQTEVSAVLEADFLVVLLPGGRGTHTEMGVALGVGKQVYLVGTDLELATDPVAFYHHPRVTRVVANDSNRNEAMHHVLAYDEAYGLLPAPVVIKPHTQAAR
jgi:nucleoside 2-deoxyribosyltransferase